MSRHVILCEADADRADAAYLIRLLHARGRQVCLVRDERFVAAEREHFVRLGVETHAVAERAMLNGFREGRQRAEARRLLDAWAAQEPLATFIRSLEYQGYSLWEAGRYSVDVLLHNCLRALDLIRDVLQAAPQPRAVSVLGNANWMRDAALLVMAQINFQGELRCIETPFAPPEARRQRLWEEEEPGTLINQARFVVPRLGLPPTEPQDLSSLERISYLGKAALGEELAEQIGPLLHPRRLLAGARNLAKDRLAYLTAALWGETAATRFEQTLRSVWHGCYTQLSGDLRDDYELYQRVQVRYTPPPAPQGRYLFCLYAYDAYIDTLLPVARRLRERSGATILWVSIGRAFRSSLITDQPDMDVTTCTQHVPPEAWPRVLAGNARLLALWSRLENAADVRDFFPYQGGSFWPLLQTGLEKLLLQEYPRLMLWIEAMQQIMQNARPRAVVTSPDSNYQTKVAQLVARRHRVPSLYVQPALIGNNGFYGPISADRAAVMDCFSRDVYVRGGTSAARLTITGLARMTGLARTLATLQADPDGPATRVRQRLELPLSGKLVVLASQPLVEMPRIARLIMQLVAQDRNLYLVIRPHPRERIVDYQRMSHSFDFSGNQPLLVKQLPLYELLAAADLLVTPLSTVALEAALLERPVLTINLGDEPDPYPFVDNGLSAGAYSEVEASELFARLLYDAAFAAQLRERQRRFRAENPDLVDGKAVERVVDVIEQMVGST